MAVTPNAYATTDDLLTVGATPTFFTSDLAPSADAQNAALNSAKSYIDSKIAVCSAITLPLAAPFDSNLVEANAAIAMWRMMSVRGFNPENSSDKAVRMRYDDAVKWLNDVAQGRAKLQTATVPRAEGVQPDISNNGDRGLRNLFGFVGNQGW